jgi:hypothetical protein
MPYVVMDVDGSIFESLKGHLKGAFSEKVVKIKGEDEEALVFDKEIFMRDYVTLQSFLNQDLLWGE